MGKFSRSSRFKPLLFFLAVLTVALLFALPLSADWRSEGRNSATLKVYTTLPAETVAPLAAEYSKSHHVNIDFVLLDSKEIIKRFVAKKFDRIGRKNNNAAAKNSTVKEKNSAILPAVVLADSDTLQEIAKLGGFIPFVSETSDQVSEKFCGKGDAWVGVWYDPMIFVMNSDYCRSTKLLPLNWKEFAALPPSVRIGLTDFLAAEAATKLFLSLIANFGEKETMAMLASIHPHVVQYSKFLATPARMAGMGEVDVAIAARSEAFRYFEKSYPIRLVWPEDGTSYVLTGVGLVAGINEAEVPIAKEFADWLISDEAQLILRSNDFYYVPVNPTALTGQGFSGRPGPLFDTSPAAVKEKTRRLLDDWVKNIRVK